MKRVMVVPGHGGKYRGRVVKTKNISGETVLIEEAVLNLKVAAMINTMLKNSGVESYLARDGDYALADNLNDDLAARAELSDALGADCLVSIHCNGFGDNQVSGFEVFTTPGETGADALAEHIFNEVETTRLIKMRSDEEDGDHDREANFAVLRLCRAPAVLVELGFITNAEDRRLIMGPQMSALAEAITRGILRWVMP